MFNYFKRLKRGMPLPKKDPVASGEAIIHHAWTVTEREAHVRSLGWYIITFACVLGVCLYAWSQKNIYLALLVCLLVIVYAIMSRQPEIRFDFKITSAGIQRGPYFYPYSELDAFWVIYQPPVKRLYIQFRSRLKPQLSIPLNDQHPVRVRDTMALYLTEDTSKEEESLTDTLQRTLKL